MITHNYPYTAGDYNFHKFKPTELSIKKEKLTVSEKNTSTMKLNFLLLLL